MGELTLTDVAQSEARLSLSQANLAQARSNLEESKAVYRSIIGIDPTNLSSNLFNIEVVKLSLDFLIIFLEKYA